jgi:hypothetical protein
LIENGQDNHEDELQTTVPVGTQCVFRDINTTVSVTRTCGIYGWHDTDTYNTGMHFIIKV